MTYVFSLHVAEKNVPGLVAAPAALAAGGPFAVPPSTSSAFV